MREQKCQHKRIKRNFPHGRKSKPLCSCKDCGKVVSKLELKEVRRNANRQKRKTSY